jgi:hypothetical protein
MDLDPPCVGFRPDVVVVGGVEAPGCADGATLQWCHRRWARRVQDHDRRPWWILVAVVVVAVFGRDSRNLEVMHPAGESAGRQARGVSWHSRACQRRRLSLPLLACRWCIAFNPGERAKQGVR